MQDNNNNSNSPVNPQKPAWVISDITPGKVKWGTWGTTANNDPFSKNKTESKTDAYPDYPEPVTVVPTYIDPPRLQPLPCDEFNGINKKLILIKKKVVELQEYMKLLDKIAMKQERIDKRIDLIIRNQVNLFQEIRKNNANAPINPLPEPKQKPQDQQEPLEEQEKEHNEEEDVFDRLMVINLPDNNPEAPAVEVLNDLLEGINEVEIPDGPDAHQIMKTKYIKQLLKLIINSPRENLEKYEKIWNEATGLLPKVVLHFMGRPDDYVDYYLEALRVFNLLDGE